MKQQNYHWAFLLEANPIMPEACGFASQTLNQRTRQGPIMVSSLSFLFSICSIQIIYSIFYFHFLWNIFIFTSF